MFEDAIFLYEIECILIFTVEQSKSIWCRLNVETGLLYSNLSQFENGTV